jgi:DNA-directed RNA polymerase specialized sigma24 family protein
VAESDSDLLTRILNDSGEALRELLRRWTKKFARHAKACSTDPEEHVAEVIRRLVVVAKSRELDSPYSYAWKISVNLREEELEKLKREQAAIDAFTEAFDGITLPPEPATATRPTAGRPGLLKRVPLRVIKKLTPPELAVFTARYRQGLSWQEAVLSLRRPLSTLTSADQRVKKKILEAFPPKGKLK